MKVLAALVFCVASLLGAAGTRGATLSIVGGSPSVLPSNFDPIGWGSPNGVNDGSAITTFSALNADSGGLYVTPSNVSLRFTFVGREAGNTNSAASELVWTGAGTLFNNQSASIGGSVTKSFNLIDGLVPLLFRTLGQVTGGATEDAINGGPIDGDLGLAFSLVFGQDKDGKPYSTVYAFFGDGLGDKDWDDMVLEISAISNVPLPGALPLLFTALAALGFLRWRHRQQVTPRSPAILIE